jgi:hypothetical protein
VKIKIEVEFEVDTDDENVAKQAVEQAVFDSLTFYTASGSDTETEVHVDGHGEVVVRIPD